MLTTLLACGTYSVKGYVSIAGVTPSFHDYWWSTCHTLPLTLRNESERMVTNTVKRTNATPRAFHTLSLNSSPLSSHNNVRVKMLWKVCDLSLRSFLFNFISYISKNVPLALSDHCHDLLPLQRYALLLSSSHYLAFPFLFPFLSFGDLNPIA